MKKYLIFWSLFFTASSLSAQMERTIYQTFEIDSAKTVSLDLVGFTSVEIIAWAGNTVLTEVNVQLWDASPEILTYFVDQGRYKFGFESKDKQVSVTTQVRERKVIKTKLSGPAGCPEITSLRLFVPDTYSWPEQLESDSDGNIVENRDGFLRWQSGNSGRDESFEDRNKHKLVKTLFLKDVAETKE